MAQIRSIATSLPAHEVRQHDIFALLEAYRPDAMPDRMLAILKNSGVEKRAIAMPVEDYFAPRSWAERMRIYARVGMDLFEQAATETMQRAGLNPRDIHAILFVSTTGTMTPGMPSRMIERMGFAPGVVTVPLFGHGCAGGALGLRLAADLAEVHGNVLFVALELCSLAYDAARTDKKNFIAAALFSDGCAAAIVSRDGDHDGDGARIGPLAQRCWPGTVDMMGWEVGDTGFDLVLAKSIPHFVESEFAPFCDDFLAAQGLKMRDLGEPACHPGGGRVVDALAAYFAPEEPVDIALPATRDILREHGNMSSPTVLFVMQAVLDQNPQRPFLYTALGPGFTGAVGLVVP